MAHWWKRYKPNRSTLPAALLGTVFTGVSLLLIWLPSHSTTDAMDRYGSSLARATAHASAGHLIHRDRIELAVIANELVTYPEIGAAVFYDTANEILAIAGDTDLDAHYTAAATLDDTITGYVSINLRAPAFIPRSYLWHWLGTLAILFISPFLSLGVLQLSARGNRSLPIVSVPENITNEPQESFCLTVNLHNQFALNREEQNSALDDAMNMAQEVCAIHHGMAAKVAGRGVVVLFERTTVSAPDAICAALLLQRLLKEFETRGEFRTCLTEAQSPGSPADMPVLDLATVGGLNLEDTLTLAALARPGTTLISTQVHDELDEDARAWTEVFHHPLLEDMETTDPQYLVTNLPDQQEALIDSQCLLILGFSNRA